MICIALKPLASFIFTYLIVPGIKVFFTLCTLEIALQVRPKSFVTNQNPH